MKRKGKSTASVLTAALVLSTVSSVVVSASSMYAQGVGLPWAAAVKTMKKTAEPIKAEPDQDQDGSAPSLSSSEENRTPEPGKGEQTVPGSDSQTPAKPEENKPDSDENQPPVQPPLPDESQKPVEPSEPSLPPEPALPVQPQEPSEPTGPELPVKPEIPAGPADGTETKPEEPSVLPKPVSPSEPDSPSKPEESKKPEESEPAKPAQPADPAQKEPVSVPESPAGPSESEKPEQPGAPVEKPSAAAPASPAAPAVPVLPVPPAAPVSPWTPEYNSPIAAPVVPTTIQVKAISKRSNKRIRITGMGSFNLLPNYENSKAWRQSNSPYNTPWLWGQCTWFAWGRFYEMYGFSPMFSGNGYQCVQQLIDYYPDQFRLSTTPAAGAVFSSDPAHNHVGIVLEYDKESDVLTIQEGNLDGISNPWNEAIDDYRTIKLSSQDMRTLYGNVTYAVPTEKVKLAEKEDAGKPSKPVRIISLRDFASRKIVKKVMAVKGPKSEPASD